MWSLLSKRYAPPAYCLLGEVRDAAGFKASRSADAIAMSLWPSRGLLLMGFEFKVSRGDWLKELKTPEKAETIAAYCDTWTLVTPPDVAKLEEIPPAWGWIVADGKRLRDEKRAAQSPAKAMDRGFLACLLRRATEGMVPASQVNELAREDVERARVEGAARTQQELGRTQRVLDETKRELETIRRDLELHSWDYRRELEQIKAYREWRRRSPEALADELRRAKNFAASALSTAEELAKVLEVGA